MIEIKADSSVYISHGDTLSLSFRLEGYTIQEGDIFVFTVKRTTADKEILIRKECSIESDNLITAIVPKDEMKKLDIGTKYYDVCVLQDMTKTTLTFPKKLIVTEVVNNE